MRGRVSVAVGCGCSVRAPFMLVEPVAAGAEESRCGRGAAPGTQAGSRRGGRCNGGGRPPRRARCASGWGLTSIWAVASVMELRPPRDRPGRSDRQRRRGAGSARLGSRPPLCRPDARIGGILPVCREVSLWSPSEREGTGSAAPSALGVCSSTGRSSSTRPGRNSVAVRRRLSRRRLNANDGRHLRPAARPASPAP